MARERMRIRMQYRDGHGDIHEWEEPSSRFKRCCLIPIAMVNGAVAFRLWWMLGQPTGINNQAGAPLIAFVGLVAVAIAIPATVVFLYAVVGIAKPDCVWKEPF